MRYYLLVDRRAEGPYEVPDLLARPDFDEASKVCFVGATSADAWRAAARVPELAQALAERAAAAQAAPEAEAAPDAATNEALRAALQEEAAAPEEEAASPAAEGEAQEWVEPETAPAEGAEEASADVPAQAEAEPVAEEAPASAEEAAAPEGSVDPGAPEGDDNPARRLIMLVEDDAEFRALLASSVRMEGFRVVTAQDGQDASGKLEPFTPDLIVTDLMMPRQGGYEFIRALQAAGHGDIPVVVVTGVDLDPSTVASMRLESNIVDFFTKPVNFSGLMNLIHDKLGTKRLSPRQKLEREKDDGWSSGA